MNLNVTNPFTNEHLPFLKRVITEPISGAYEVKGAAIDASASESDNPTSAVFKALQSFAPSPHIPTI